MRNQNHPIRLTATLMIFIVALFAEAQATSSKVIHHFNNNQGRNPEGVVIGPDGGLYGVTNFGGGTVFELTRNASGQWRETKVYDNTNLPAANPNGNLIFDSAGNIYGTLQSGDTWTCGCCPCGEFGAVFELSPIPGGPGWHATLVVNFYSIGFARTISDNVIEDGDIMFPVSGLTRDSAGNLYGMAVGADGLIDLQFLGALYKLSPSSGGGWTLADGPYGEGLTSGPVVIDTNENLYGVSGALNGGPLGWVWRVDSSGVLTTLYTFELSKNGDNPISQGGLVLDSAGNLYGTTQNGGAFNKGTVFKLKHNADGSWSERVLYSFDGTHGGHPTAGVVFDAAGNLYGEAYDGGEGNSGIVFKLSPTSGGHWNYVPLRSFHGPDGSGPSYGLTLDSSGNLYGTTWTGGAYGNGTVFEITP